VISVCSRRASCSRRFTPSRTGDAERIRTNKAFAEWGEVFPHAACVVTLVDRLIHRAEVIEIEAESYRLKEAKELSAARAKQRRTKKS
jgi:hypothetical protein